ncbi:MAG: phosphatase PAP2 family protein [Thermodesulfovibrionales bacterium]|nr:phosphatase PAP2 family protein [Thermodesulfovibrionales bacterium]
MGWITQKLLQQRPADTVTITFLAFLAALTVFFYQSVPKAPVLVTLYLSLILIQMILIRFNHKGKSLCLVYDLVFPTLCVLVIFDSLEWLVHYVNPRDIDPLLIWIDYLIFGGHPTVILENFMTPILTDFLQLAYSTYYFIPVSYGVILLLNRQHEEFNISLFLILLCFYLSYLGYILFPALGPRFYLDYLQTTELRGYLVAEPLMNLLNRLEGIKRDAFPSGHTAITLIVLYLSYKFKRVLFWIYLPIVAALIFSAVYCRYHYVIDIIAGVGLTMVTIVIGEWYYRWWEGKRGVKYL